MGCGRQEIKNMDSKGRNIICFGDSITVGYGAGPKEDYPAILSGMVKLPVINAGIDGDTTAEALKRIKSDVIIRQPRLVIIEFGGNDFLRKVAFSDTMKNMEAMIQIIQSAGAMAAIADISVDMVMSDYRREFRRLAKKYKAIFIPNLYKGIIANPALKYDNIHPNAEGYKLIAKRIHKSIVPYLN
jgi:acyl-CoA thioesterase-1